MPSPAVAYLIFDVESIADGELVSRIRYPGEDHAPEKAIEKYCSERLEETGTEFIPYTFHIPIAIAIIKITVDFKIIDIVTLDAPQYRPHVITKHFWDGWRKYDRPTFVTFNGRTFDIPLMELAAYRYGIGIPEWFNLRAKSYEQRRNRYNLDAHFDLQDVYTNFSTTRLNGGLNLMANLLGLPGKMGIQGHMVQALYNEGQLAQINDYCRCDVLDTYFIFLRTKVLSGELSLDQEQKLVADTKQWLEDRVEDVPVYGEYLNNTTQWLNPWK
jgi:predicted PolB exonuclease-like 3'-5' exonuclease